MSKTIFILRNTLILVWALAAGVLALLKGELLVPIFLLYLLIMPVMAALQLIASFQSRVGIATTAVNVIALLHFAAVISFFAVTPTTLDLDSLQFLLALSLGIGAAVLSWRLVREVIRYKRPKKTDTSERKQVKTKVVTKK